MSIHTRLRTLERATPARIDPADCDGGPTFHTFIREGTEPEPVPDDAPRCAKCGDVHHLQITEVVVTSREELDALKGT